MKTLLLELGRDPEVEIEGFDRRWDTTLKLRFCVKTERTNFVKLCKNIPS